MTGVNVILNYCAEDSRDPQVWNTNTDIVVDLFEKASKMNGVRFVPLKISSITSAEVILHSICIWVVNIVQQLEKVSKLITTYGAAHFEEHLSPEDREQLNEVKNKLIKICNAAKQVDISLLIDAEQSFKQPAVEYFAMYLTKQFNTEKPLVYNTYQLYMKGSVAHLAEQMEWAKKNNVYIGCNLVRGNSAS
jgi:hypothetical protein